MSQGRPPTFASAPRPTPDLLSERGIEPTGKNETARSALAGYRTKTELVYQELRRAILAGDFMAGSRVVADQVAVEMGVSRVPVREAIGRLVGEGWLESSAHIGAMVPLLSPHDILETSVVRAALEATAAKHAVEFLTVGDLARLSSLSDRMEVAAKTDAPEFPELNLAFHAGLINRCPFPSLREQAGDLAQKALRWRTVRLLPRYLPETQREHRAILKAARARDGETLSRLVQEHSEVAGRLLCEFATDAAVVARVPSA